MSSAAHNLLTTAAVGATSLASAVLPAAPVQATVIFDGLQDAPTGTHFWRSQPNPAFHGQWAGPGSPFGDWQALIPVNITSSIAGQQGDFAFVGSLLLFTSIGFHWARDADISATAPNGGVILSNPLEVQYNWYDRDTFDVLNATPIASQIVSTPISNPTRLGTNPGNGSNASFLFDYALTFPSDPGNYFLGFTMNSTPTNRRFDFSTSNVFGPLPGGVGTTDYLFGRNDSDPYHLADIIDFRYAARLSVAPSPSTAVAALSLGGLGMLSTRRRRELDG